MTLKKRPYRATFAVPKKKQIVHQYRMPDDEFEKLTKYSTKKGVNAREFLSDIILWVDEIAARPPKEVEAIFGKFLFLKYFKEEN